MSIAKLITANYCVTNHANAVVNEFKIWLIYRHDAIWLKSLISAPRKELLDKLGQTTSTHNSAYSHKVPLAGCCFPLKSNKLVGLTHSKT